MASETTTYRITVASVTVTVTWYPPPFILENRSRFEEQVIEKAEQGMGFVHGTDDKVWSSYVVSPEVFHREPDVVHDHLLRNIGGYYLRQI